MVFTSGCGAEGHQSNGTAAKDARPAALTPAQRAKLPKATTFTTVHGAPADPSPNGRSDGTVLRASTDQVVYASPGGKAIAVLPSKQLDGPTWVPVIESRGDWRHILLPSRPNHSSGWLYDSSHLRTAHSPYRISVGLKRHKLAISKSGKQLGSWKVGVGSAKNPTPTGRTFLLASLAPPKPKYSRLILPLGAHSNSLSSFGGGPGTVALHGWPDAKVFGKNVSHGCVRTPKSALDPLSKIPLGSPVQIT